MKKYKIIALIGEAGSGKDFLLRCARSKYPNYNIIISCTTRPKRMGEVEGINYYYLTNEEFAQQVLDGSMLEATIFNDWCYGTSINSLDDDKINIGVFNPEGIEILNSRADIDLRVFYVRAPAKMRLIRQLKREDDPDIEEVLRRYRTDENDFAVLDFDYVSIKNESIEDIDTALELLGWPED